MMMINRRRVCGGKSLPYDAEIEYLESLGEVILSKGAYINTEFTPKNTTRVVIKVKGNYVADRWFFGARTAYANNAFGFYGNNSSTFFAAQYGGNYIDFGKYDFENSRVIVDFNGAAGTCTLSSEYGSTVSKGIGAGSFTAPCPLCLFCLNNNGNAISFAGTKMYAAKIYDNGVLVRDYIPVRKGTTGYLYDKISGQLFGNAGTDDFILGADKLGALPVGYTQVEYIERGVNDAYIDTGYVLDFSETIELKMSVISWNGSYDRIFGNYNNEDSNCTRVIRDGANNSNLFVEYNRKAKGGATIVPMTLGQPFVLSLSNSEYVMDGVSYTPKELTGNAYNSTLKICESPNTKARIYYVKIGNKRDFIPCISPNGHVGLFDLKEGWFYRSNTNNAFTAGPVV